MGMEHTTANFQPRINLPGSVGIPMRGDSITNNSTHNRPGSDSCPACAENVIQIVHVCIAGTGNREEAATGHIAPRCAVIWENLASSPAPLLKDVALGLRSKGQ